MKRLMMIGGLLGCTASIFAANTTLTTDAQKLSYTIGYKTGAALKGQSIAINTQDFATGLQAGYSGAQPSLTDQEMQATLSNMQQQVSKNTAQQQQAEANMSQKAGEDFLANNSKQPGVITLPSGLQYKVLKAGQGASPKASDTVTVNYEGTLINGKVFDSSYQRGTPATFQVGAVIPGWQEALQLMKPGATWMLYIPAKLAYGSQGAGGLIGPNETLIFKVDLISVK